MHKPFVHKCIKMSVGRRTTEQGEAVWGVEAHRNDGFKLGVWFFYINISPETLKTEMEQLAVTTANHVEAFRIK